MPTVINNPGPSNSSDGSGMGVGVIVGIIIAVLIVALLFFWYGLPMLRGAAPQQPGGLNINVQLPANNPAGGGGGGNQPAH